MCSNTQGYRSRMISQTTAEESRLATSAEACVPRRMAVLGLKMPSTASQRININVAILLHQMTGPLS